ncbi:MAG: ClpXP protease specificity-enhancing factor SspB [Pseudomonadota bacterium]
MPGRFHYGQLMHKALRGLMAEVLAEVAENGLPGEHHFFIGFDTGHPGVDMADHLRERFPEEMTIVIQEWFEDLTVLSDRFSITLNFSNQRERLVIPFGAIRTFVDPSAEFGLRFDEQSDDAEHREVQLEDLQSDDPEDDPPTGGGVVRLDQFRKT